MFIPRCLPFLLHSSHILADLSSLPLYSVATFLAWPVEKGSVVGQTQEQSDMHAYSYIKRQEIQLVGWGHLLSNSTSH